MNEEDKKPIYYICEASRDDYQVRNVIPANSADEAIEISRNSKADIKFVSTINPLENE